MANGISSIRDEQAFMENVKMQIKSIFRIVSNKRAMSSAVSATLLAGAVVALSFAVLGWVQSRSSDYNSEFGETIDAETAKLREKLVFEHIFYNSTSDTVTAFLMNCGTIDGVRIQVVFICDSSSALIEIFTNPPLYSFQTWDEIPYHALDVGGEGRVVLQPSTSLSGGLHSFKVVTARGAAFESWFVV